MSFDSQSLPSCPTCGEDDLETAEAEALMDAPPVILLACLSCGFEAAMADDRLTVLSPGVGDCAVTMRRHRVTQRA